MTGRRHQWPQKGRRASADEMEKQILPAATVAWLLHQSKSLCEKKRGWISAGVWSKIKEGSFYVSNAASSPLNRDLQMLVISSRCNPTDLEHFLKMNEVKLSCPHIWKWWGHVYTREHISWMKNIYAGASSTFYFYSAGITLETCFHVNIKYFL